MTKSRLVSRQASDKFTALPPKYVPHSTIAPGGALRIARTTVNCSVKPVAERTRSLFRSILSSRILGALASMDRFMRPKSLPFSQMGHKKGGLANPPRPQYRRGITFSFLRRTREVQEGLLPP